MTRNLIYTTGISKSDLSTTSFPWCPLLSSDLDWLLWTEQCWRYMWWSVEKSSVGGWPREQHSDKGATGPFRHHPGALLCWRSLCPEWLCLPWWQDRHLESWVDPCRHTEKVHTEHSHCEMTALAELNTSHPFFFLFYSKYCICSRCQQNAIIYFSFMFYCQAINDMFT